MTIKMMIGRGGGLLIQNGVVHYFSEVRVGATNTDSEWGCANYFSKNEGGAAYPAGGGH